MTAISHESVRPEPSSWWMQLLVPELWAFLAIALIWLSVLFSAVYGPEIHTNGVAGDSATVPSVVVVSFFAFLSTWAVAAYGFRSRR
jgi:hypothetical protein